MNLIRKLAVVIVGMIALGGSCVVQATIIDFNTDPYTAAVNIGLNGEVDGFEWNHLGIEFSTPGTLNVGCSSLLRGDTEGGCLGADIDFNDFAGTLSGNFVLPGTSIDAYVSYLVLDFCVCSSQSEILLFGIDGSLLTAVTGNFAEQTLVFDSYQISSFSIILGLDGSALDFIEFSDPIPAPERRTVVIDIKPGGDPNSIQPSGKQKISVAILTTDTPEVFYALDVDPLSVKFGPGEATETHKTSHVTDVDDDGDMDLLLHFNTQETGIQCGDTDATLTGETFGGDAIIGSDAIKTVKCP